MNDDGAVKVRTVPIFCFRKVIFYKKFTSISGCAIFK